MYDTVILVPYRGRPTQYKYFMEKIIPVLKKNTPISTKIVFIEQDGESLFNRGKLLNVGCKLFQGKTKHFIFHDLNIEPTDAIVKRDYAAPLAREQVRGIYVNASKSLGGVVKIKHDTLFMTNGHHNELWGWGLDDREFRHRIDYFRFGIRFCTVAPEDSNKKPVEGFKLTKNETGSVEYDPNKLKHNFIEHTFKQLTDKEQRTWIMSSGLNNVDYEEVKRNTISDFVEHIIVKI